MDLVIYGRPDGAFREECRAACEFTHRQHIAGLGDAFWITATSESAAVAEAIKQGVSDTFILTQETTFLTGPFDVSVLHKQRGGWATRRGEHTERMVKTVRFLLLGGWPSFDYELPVPIIVDKRMAQQVLDYEVAPNAFFRTLYCNTYFDTPELMDSPLIDIWSHFMQPEGPVISVSRTALKHKMCRRWISKLVHAPV